jgi:adenylylsulfate kinase
MESHKRSIVKAISWRILAALITAFTVFIFTNEATLSVGVGIADSAIKLLIYYSHERLWNRSSFGRKKDLKKEFRGDYAI